MAKAKTKKQKQSSTVLDRQIVVLKKMASEDELPKQAVGILKVLKSAGGKLPASTLVERMKSHVESKQSMMAIWSWFRRRLREDGYVAIQKASS